MSRSSPAKEIMLKRSLLRKPLTPNDKAERACSILLPSCIEPEVSTTKIISLAAYSDSVSSSFGEMVKR